MMGLVEQLALPFLATCWLGGLLTMAWLVFRAPRRLDRLEEPRDQAESAPVRPRGPLTASQMAGLNRRRRLAR